MSRQLENELWVQYSQYLSNITNSDTKNDRIAYAKKYYHILSTGNASELLSLSNDKRIHVMKSLASLSKYIGCYDKWTEIRHKYQLKWSNSDSLGVFNTMYNSKYNYSSMLEWVKDSIRILPKSCGNALIYCTLSGLRPDEAFRSIRLFQTEKENYLNEKLMTLEHFKYPHIFFRRTKKAYITIINKKIFDTVEGTDCLTYNSMNMLCKRNNMGMKMSYCRKIFATHLRVNGIEQETIDLLQGRIPKSIFGRYYFRPDPNFDKVRKLLDNLSNSILN